MPATYGDLERALAPILRDLRSQHAWLELRIEPTGRSEDHLAVAWEPSGSGTGLYLDDSGTWAEAIVDPADQVQAVVVEALWSARRGSTWPFCPEHPRTHPLDPAVVAGEAFWMCPKSGHPIWTIGAVPGSS